MKDVRTNRNIRLNDDEWQDFRELLGTEWLRCQIAKARKRADRKHTCKTER